jgi:hypothetical protein
MQSLVRRGLSLLLALPPLCQVPINALSTGKVGPRTQVTGYRTYRDLG